MTAKNLAVIFRPALLSHPTHELSPHEHQLSQDVLEFLIAHQDWFMLDIPPPPTSSTGAGTVNSKTVAPVLTSGMSENVDIIPSSDDEVGGGWKLVDKDTSNHKVHRRRTMTERSGEGKNKIEVGELATVPEAPPSRSGSQRSGATVSRSRTLPSRKKEASSGGNSTTDDERTTKLVKKQKRASAQPRRKRTIEVV